MAESVLRFREIVMPALLRHARGTYGRAMQQALKSAGYSDVPRNGPYVIGGLALGAGEAPLSRLVQEMGISKQAVGQLIDTLVTRGYLEREPDAHDRRRLTVTLTERGHAAALVQAEARRRVDAQLLARVGAEDLARTRRTLAALRDIGRQEQDRE